MKPALRLGATLNLDRVREALMKDSGPRAMVDFGTPKNGARRWLQVAPPVSVEAREPVQVGRGLSMNQALAVVIKQKGPVFWRALRLGEREAVERALRLEPLGLHYEVRLAELAA